ncbi:MAG: GNAT family N-acetyltransferase [Desulfobacteraceae bacterium]|nr:GNAT family N-acetyltransferase [Desulfobacteraceae bacterium]MBC2750298.1 GNAT family N-acetyltransferase [Desulfobacteraceae bacterium]
MKTVFQPKIEINPRKEDLELLRLGIDENNILITGESTGNQDITFFVRNADNEIIGGIRGTYNISGWLYINALWVDKNYRNQGYATLLMQCMENEAKRNGCKNSFLNTIAFQAPEFYVKLGYKKFAELENFHHEYNRIFLRKKL